ncbi:MAG: hypothetical protein JW818_22945 [Pirellulales bacterium]|nr:hypothetical protein [Pirellulales bacterium]
MLASFLQLLDGRQPQQIVWTADITYWISGRQEDGTAKPEWDTEEGYLKLHDELGILPYYYYKKFWAGEPCYDDSVELIDEQDGHVQTRRIRTPRGELTERSVYSPESCSWGITKHFVKTEEDLDVLLDLVRRRRWTPSHLDDWPKRRDLWAAHGGYPCIGLPRSPLSAFFVEWAGVESATFLIVDYPERIEELFGMMEEQETPVLDAICRLAPPLVHFPDNLTSESLTSFYDRHMAAGHRRRIERLRASGVRCAVHLDGTVKGLLPKLVRSGFDAIEALTPKPAGDLSCAQMRDLADNDRVILWGGVPGVMFAPPYTWPQMKAHVEQTLEAWRDRLFVLGVADQVPPDGDINFCRRIAELVR